MPRTNGVSTEAPLSWPLRLAHYAALTLIALTTVVVLVVLIKVRFADHGPSSSPSPRQTESPLINRAWQHPGVAV